MKRQNFPLLHEIESDKGSVIAVLSARLLTLGENIAAIDDGVDEMDSLDIMVRTITGLTETELDKLSSPDFNAVSAYVDMQRTQTAADFSGKKLDDDNPELLVPIEANGGAEVVKISLKVPTVKMIRQRDKEGKTDMDRARWLTAACAGVGLDDLLNLSMPDWLQLQVRLGNFLTEPAAYFQK